MEHKIRKSRQIEMLFLVNKKPKIMREKTSRHSKQEELRIKIPQEIRIRERFALG